LRTLRSPARYLAREQHCSRAPLGIEFPELRDRLLNNLAPAPN